MAAESEIYILMLDRSVWMPNYWDAAYHEVLARYDRLQEKGVIVKLFVFSNGTYPVVLARKPGHLVRLETKEGHAIDGTDPTWRAQPYRAFGRAWETFKDDAERNKRVTVEIWSSGRSVDSIWHPYYHREAVLRRFTSWQKEHPKANARVAIQWKLMSKPPSNNEGRMFAKCIEKTTQQCIDELNVSLRDTAPAIVQLPSGDLELTTQQKVNTSIIYFMINASPSLHGIPYDISARLKGVPGAQVLVNRAEAENTLEYEDCQLWLAFNAEDLKIGSNVVELEFKARLAEDASAKTLDLAVMAHLPPPTIVVHPTPESPRVLQEYRPGKPYSPPGATLELHCQNVTADDVITLTPRSSKPGLTAKLRPRGSKKKPEAPYVTNGHDAEQTFELVLEGDVAFGQDEQAVITVEVTTPRLEDTPAAEYRVDPSEDCVIVNIEPFAPTFLGGDSHAIMKIALLPPDFLRGRVFNISMADETRTLVAERYLECLEVVRPDGTEMPMGSIVLPEEGDLALTVRATAAAAIPVPSGTEVSERVVIVLKPSPKFAFCGQPRGDEYRCIGTVSFLGPVGINVAGSFRREGETLIIGQTLRGRFIITNQAPGRLLGPDPVVRAYLGQSDSEGTFTISGVRTTPGVTFSAETEIGEIALSDSAQPIEFEPILQAVREGSVRADLVFEVKARSGLRLNAGESIVTFPVEVTRIRRPYIDKISWVRPKEFRAYYGASHELEGMLNINGRTLLGKSACLKGSIMGEELPEGSKLIFFDESWPRKDSQEAKIVLETGKEDVVWSLPVDEAGEISATYTAKLELGCKQIDDTIELTLAFGADDVFPLQIPKSLARHTVRLSASRPAVRLSFMGKPDDPNKMFGVLKPDRGWRGRIKLEELGGWREFLGEDKSQPFLSVPVQAILTLADMAEPLASLQVTKSDGAEWISIQGLPLREWLDTEEIELFVPAWSSQSLPELPFELKVELGPPLVVAAEEPFTGGLLEELPPHSVGWGLLVFLALLGAVAITVIVQQRFKTQMIGELVADGAAPEDEGSKCSLSGRKIIVGSDESRRHNRDYFYVPDESVQPYHARLGASQESASVRSNGVLPYLDPLPSADTYVDGNNEPQTGRVLLRDGMAIRFGRVSFTYRMLEEPWQLGARWSGGEPEEKDEDDEPLP